MKSFLVLLSEKQTNSLNDEMLKNHIDYLKQLRANGHLPICGPFTDNYGAVLIIRAESLNQAEKIIKDDPFIREKYYRKMEIKEFMEANEDNNWLATSDQTKGNLHNDI